MGASVHSRQRKERPCLSLAQLQVRMVNESDVVPQQYLPTFSSLVLEAYLHRIPGTPLRAARCARPATSALPALLHTSCAPRTDTAVGVRK